MYVLYIQQEDMMYILYIQQEYMMYILYIQQEDMVSLGKLVLALACNSIIAVQRDNIQASVELVARNYSTDLKNLIL